MIRGLYSNMDKYFKDLEDKFKKDEMELRIKIDSEIKSQMADKLKKINYNNTENYKSDFLESISLITSHLSYDYNTYKNPINNYGLHFDYNRTNIEDILSFHGFFENITELNHDCSLYQDEYIIGFIGNISFQNNNIPNNSYNNQGLSNKKIGCRFTDIKLKVITNYLNFYDVINQYDLGQINNNKQFNERFQLKLIRKNDMKLFDKQIDIIVSIFGRIQLFFTEQLTTSQNYETVYYNFYTYYDNDISNYINEFNNSEILKEKINTYRNSKHSLKVECIKNDSNLNKYICCQKCFDEQEKIDNQKIVNGKTKMEKNLQNRGSYSGKLYYSTIHIKHNYNLNIFEIFENQFNDFWADKIQEISGESKADISMAQLIEHKDKNIADLQIQNKELERKNKLLENQVSQNIHCKEYETQLKEQIKTQNLDIENLNSKLKTIEEEKSDLNQKYQALKSKIQALMS